MPPVLPLHQVLTDRVAEWRAGGYPAPDAAAISDILEWARDGDGSAPRYLRRAQLRALETYWYLRLVERTPHVFDLYRNLYTRPIDQLRALGVEGEAVTEALADDGGIEGVWRRIREDDAFVKSLGLESVRETMTLNYPSWILALAMGAGMTALIGAIIATEFAMAMEYADGPFVRAKRAVLHSGHDRTPADHARTRRAALREDCAASVAQASSRGPQTHDDPRWRAGDPGDRRVRVQRSGHEYRKDSDPEGNDP